MTKLFRYLILFILIQGLNTAHGDPIIIHKTVKEENENFFHPKGLDLKLLQECSDVIPILVKWLYDEWHSYDKSLTIEKITCDLNKYLNDDGFPFMVVALKDKQPIGIISLDNEREPEFEDLGNGNPWVGNFHVVPEERNQGIGQELGHLIITLAKNLGFQELNFYTSKLSNVEKYLKRGAYIVEMRPYRGHTATVMRISLKM